MIGAFVKGFDQLGDPDTRRVIWLSLSIAIAVFVALLVGSGALLAQTAFFQLAWLETVVDLLGGLAALVLAWLLFPAVVSASVGLFLERVADAVERRHFAHLPPAREAPMSEIIGTTLRFLAVMIALNLVILVFLPFPVVFPFVFYGVNGYLLGREYFELVALRRVDAAEAKVLRTRHRSRLFVAGLAIAILLTIPVVNLMAPIVGTAAMVHLFEAWRVGRGTV